MKHISILKNNLLRAAMTLALIVTCATARAQEITWTEVGTKEALNSAIADGAYIRLTADITLSEYLKIGQSNNQTVTIDLNGHTLSRSLNAADANGHVIEVFSNGTLTLQGGTLTGGWANNGGGICNYGSLTIGDKMSPLRAARPRKAVASRITRGPHFAGRRFRHLYRCRWSWHMARHPHTIGAGSRLCVCLESQPVQDPDTLSPGRGRKTQKGMAKIILTIPFL